MSINRFDSCKTSDDVQKMIEGSSHAVCCTSISYTTKQGFSFKLSELLTFLEGSRFELTGKLVRSVRQLEVKDPGCLFRFIQAIVNLFLGCLGIKTNEERLKALEAKATPEIIPLAPVIPPSSIPKVSQPSFVHSFSSTLPLEPSRPAVRIPSTEEMLATFRASQAADKAADEAEAKAAEERRAKMMAALQAQGAEIDKINAPPTESEMRAIAEKAKTGHALSNEEYRRWSEHVTVLDLVGWTDPMHISVEPGRKVRMREFLIQSTKIVRLRFSLSDIPTLHNPNLFTLAIDPRNHCSAAWHVFGNGLDVRKEVQIEIVVEKDKLPVLAMPLISYGLEVLKNFCKFVNVTDDAIYRQLLAVNFPASTTAEPAQQKAIIENLQHLLSPPQRQKSDPPTWPVVGDHIPLRPDAMKDLADNIHFLFNEQNGKPVLMPAWNEWLGRLNKAQQQMLLEALLAAQKYQYILCLVEAMYQPDPGFVGSRWHQSLFLLRAIGDSKYVKAGDPKPAEPFIYEALSSLILNRGSFSFNVFSNATLFPNGQEAWQKFLGRFAENREPARFEALLQQPLENSRRTDIFKTFGVNAVQHILEKWPVDSAKLGTENYVMNMALEALLPLFNVEGNSVDQHAKVADIISRCPADSNAEPRKSLVKHVIINYSPAYIEKLVLGICHQLFLTSNSEAYSNLLRAMPLMICSSENKQQRPEKLYYFFKAFWTQAKKIFSMTKGLESSMQWELNAHCRELEMIAAFMRAAQDAQIEFVPSTTHMKPTQFDQLWVEKLVGRTYVKLLNVEDLSAFNASFDVDSLWKNYESDLRMHQVAKLLKKHIVVVKWVATDVLREKIFPGYEKFANDIIHYDFKMTVSSTGLIDVALDIILDYCNPSVSGIDSQQQPLAITAPAKSLRKYDAFARQFKVAIKGFIKPSPIQDIILDFYRG